MKNLLIGLLSIFLGFLFVSCPVSTFDPEKDKKVLQEACEVPSPPKTKKEDEREIIRSHAGVTSKFYIHESGCPDVENYYETFLKSRGWEKVPKTFFNNPDSNDFKKGDLTFSLACSEIMDFRGIKRFSFSCSKGLY